MGFFGERLAERDVAIGLVLSLALGVGLLFLNFFTGSSVRATSLLFGNVLGVDKTTLWRMAGTAALILTALAVLSRPLLFALRQARACGSPRASICDWCRFCFLALVGVAVAEAVQVVGVLLVFTLMVGASGDGADEDWKIRIWPLAIGRFGGTAGALRRGFGVSDRLADQFLDQRVERFFLCMRGGCGAAAALAKLPKFSLFCDKTVRFEV